MTCEICPKPILTRGAKRFCSCACYGVFQRKNMLGNKHGFLQGMTTWNKGKRYDAIRGSKNVNWKGGVSPINEKIRHLPEYKEWRRHVFQRDDYTCQACGDRGVTLHADHELPFSVFPDLRFEILNGRTLCVPCHKKTPTWANPKNIAELFMLNSRN